MRRTRAFAAAAAILCLLTTSCKDSVDGSPLGGLPTAGSPRSSGPVADPSQIATSGGAQDGTPSPRTGGGDGSGGGDGTGGGNQDGSGGAQDGSGDGQGGSGDGGSSSGDNSQGGSGDGSSGGSESGSGSLPTSVASDGIPSIDHAEVVCEDDGAGGWHPYLHYAVSDTTGLEVNLNSEGTDDQGGYHNYETSYEGLTGSVPMPYTGCYSEYGEHIYRLTVVGHYDDNDLTEEQFELGERTISMTGEHHDENATPPAPRIDEYVLSCVWNSGSSMYDMFLTYSVANATGMALSIDNPGVVGSFGSYGPSGTIEIPNLGCYGENGEQTYDLYTVGGAEPQAVVNLTRTGEHNYTDTPTDVVTDAVPTDEIPTDAELPDDVATDEVPTGAEHPEDSDPTLEGAVVETTMEQPAS